MLTLLLLLSPDVRAASLDNLDVGGLWASPTLSSPAAAWWNPAAVNADGGHQIFAEGAPTLADISYARTDPRGGPNNYTLQGVIPAFGASSDFGVEGLGVGAALTVPIARGADADGDLNGGDYYLRDGLIQTIDITLAARYAWKGRFGAGLALHRYQSSWTANLSNDVMPDLYDEIVRQGQTPDADIYNDDNLENPRYAAELNLDPVGAGAWGVSVGLWAQPTDTIQIGAAWLSGVRLDHRGDAVVDLSCPPQEDEAGRFGAEAFGLCDASVRADVAINYDLPSRIHLGIAAQVAPTVRVEAFGGFVRWSVFQDLEIILDNVDRLNDGLAEEAVDLIEQERLWARDNRNSVFAALDARGPLGERWGWAGRVMVDRAAVPDEALSMNNFDANAVTPSAMVTWRPIDKIQLGVSGSRAFLASRTVTNSGFGMAVLPEDRNPNRWFYPQANGTYSTSIVRLSLGLQVTL
ncbi:MAG: outer membrane protein transport protein [Myxococcota bacterium]